MAKKSKSKKRSEVINLLLPLDLLDFYKKVATINNVTPAKVIEILTTVEAFATIAQADAAKQVKKGKRK